jgi:hypothetical protein
MMHKTFSLIKSKIGAGAGIFDIQNHIDIGL